MNKIHANALHKFYEQFCIYVISAFFQDGASIDFIRFSMDLVTALIKNHAFHLLGRDCFDFPRPSQHCHPLYSHYTLFLLCADQVLLQFLFYFVSLDCDIIQDRKYISSTHIK